MESLAVPNPATTLVVFGMKAVENGGLSPVWEEP
jgi:hypothetical protein